MTTFEIINNETGEVVDAVATQRVAEQVASYKQQQTRILHTVRDAVLASFCMDVVR